MKVKELFKSWIVDLVSSGLGVALIVYSLEIKKENPYWIMGFIMGLILQVPTFYFKLWKYLEEKF